MNKALIIDGNSILNRAFYGIRALNAPDGTPTNAVYGFLNILFKYLEEDTPDYVAVAFDLKGKTFRHEKFEQYKAQRKPAPEDLVVQMPIIKEVLKAMNYTCLEKEGYEADDIIGSFSRVCEEKGVECSILTGDKDDLQLASDLTKVKLVVTKMGQTTTTVFGKDDVIARYSVTPSEFIDVKGLMGDPSDNIPGVSGIGEKTAFSLIEKYKSIEDIYEKLSDIDVTPSVRKKLETGKDIAFLSKELSTIDRFVPMDFEIEKYKIGEFNKKNLAEIFSRLNFKTFINKFSLELDSDNKNAVGVKGIKIENNQLKDILLSFDKIFYYLDGKSEKSLYFSVDGEKIYYIKNISYDNLKFIFENRDISKIGYGIKDDIVKLDSIGIEYENLGFDILIAAYISDPSKPVYEINELLFSYLSISINVNQTNNESQVSMAFEQEDDDEFSGRVYAIIKLYEYLSEKLKADGQEKLYYEIELPLIKVLADMQITGVYIDKNALFDFGEKLKEQIKELERSIYEEAGEEFNINSPKQLGKVLFENLNLPHGKKTKTGYSTNIDVLRKLEGVHPIIEYIMDYRHMAKLQSTYVDGLLNVINPKTGRIYSNFNQTVTATGRISSTEPNLQNIPIRLSLGRELRKMFTSEGDDKVFVDADYSQIELRVLAHIADDKNMQNAFLNNIDIHTQTASQVFNVSVGDVTSIMRTRAKAVNFGIVYGIGEFSLSQDLRISIKEAKSYIEEYLKNYPNVKKYMEETVENGKRDGYVSTIMGRRRYIPELSAANKITQAFGERIAMNAPIQGSAADIIKVAMVNVYRRLKEAGLKSKLILQIHDELIVETLRNELDKVEKILKDEMENAVVLKVPIDVDMKSGKSWYDTK